MSVHNEDIAVIFDEMADLLEIEEANPFRVRAYRNAARTVRGLGKELADMLAAGDDLTKLPGIGKDLAAKIAEILKTGTAKSLKELHREVPASLEDLLKIPGLGPKRVKLLYKELGIKTLKQLERAANSGKIDALPGFGEKTRKSILEAIGAHRVKKKRFLVSIARDYAEALTAWLKKTSSIKDVVVAGSYRRGRDTVGDLDILATTSRPEAVMKRFTAFEDVSKVVSQGETRATVLLKSGLQVDLRVVEHASFGAALHYFTGSKAHNIHIRRLGQQRDLKINEYGVFKGTKRVAGRTEASVFKAVGLPLIPPELREDRGEIEAAGRGKLPDLVKLADLKGDLHVHTHATDGQASVKEMALAAKKAGLNYLAITDHSRHLTVAHGLDEKRLAKQLEEIDTLNASLKGITLLKGIEVDILEDGRLDLPESILSKLDLVIGAVHGKFRLSQKQQTMRILKAMDSRYFSMLAHPSGRLLEDRPAYDVDMPRIIRHAWERGCFLELNAQPKRLDLTDVYCQAARDAGVLVSINSDAHSAAGFANLRYGVNQARRGWLEKKHVLNTRGLRELRVLLKKTMG
jgi:DNA polymerase (family 10)